MAWPGTVLAEVIRGAYDSRAEMMHPDPVHDHPGGERILPGTQPVGEGEPPLLLGSIFLQLEAAQYIHRAWLHLLPLLQRVAAIEPVGRPWLSEGAHVGFYRFAGGQLVAASHGLFQSGEGFFPGIGVKGEYRRLGSEYGTPGAFP